MSRPEPTYFFDRKAGKWRICLWISDSVVHNDCFPTEAQARNAIGLDGGNDDPTYIPEAQTA